MSGNLNRVWILSRDTGRAKSAIPQAVNSIRAQDLVPASTTAAATMCALDHGNVAIQEIYVNMKLCTRDAQKANDTIVRTTTGFGRRVPVQIFCRHTANAGSS